MRFAAAICAALLCLCASGVPIGLRTAMWGDDVVSLESFELTFGDHAIVAFDDSDNIDEIVDNFIDYCHADYLKGD